MGRVAKIKEDKMRQIRFTWVERSSFNFRLRCECGWEARDLMERDVIKKAREHVMVGHGFVHAKSLV